MVACRVATDQDQPVTFVALPGTVKVASRSADN